MTKVVIGILVVLILLCLVIQVLPLGKQHNNPPVGQEPAWDSQQTRQLARLLRLPQQRVGMTIIVTLALCWLPASL